MTTLFEEFQSHPPRKEFRALKKPRTRQRKGVYEARWFSGSGPVQGLKIIFDRDDPIFPRKWVLSYHDVVISIFRKFPEELWTELAKKQQEQRTESLEEIPIEIQDLHRKWEDARYRSMEFWDRVAMSGKLPHHAKLDLRTAEEADEDYK